MFWLEVLPGYYESDIRLELTERELAELKSIAALTGNGTISAAIRQQMGWPERPHGIIAAERRAAGDDSQVT